MGHGRLGHGGHYETRASYASHRRNIVGQRHRRRLARQVVLDWFLRDGQPRPLRECPDAIVAADDRMALAVLDALRHDLGLVVPDHLIPQLSPIPALTFTASLMAAGKLQEVLPTRPMTYKNQNFVNLSVLGAALLGLLALAPLLPAFPDHIWGPDYPWTNRDFLGGWWLWWAEGAGGAEACFRTTVPSRRPPSSPGSA